MNGKPIRQDYLEAVIRWIAAKEGKEIEDYMAEHQHEPTANELWLYFNSVANWVNRLMKNSLFKNLKNRCV